MNKFSSTTLLLLMMLPVFWNFSVLVHYLVEHTHAFCESEQNHSHVDVADCETAFQLAPQSDKSQLPAENKLLELNHYFSASLYLQIGESLINSDDAEFNYLPPPSRARYHEIFRPPIS